MGNNKIIFYQDDSEVTRKLICFTEEELNFIINYDIKYRMGDELNVDE